MFNESLIRKDKILFVHLLNNYTGSPTVLSNLLRSINNKEKYNIGLLTSNTEGVLDNIENIRYYSNYYRWSNNKLLLAIFFCISQLYQFLFVILSKKNDVVYVNTILPFGAALGAKLKNCRVIYHVHEFYNKPNLMQRICIKIAQYSASEIVFVSNYLATCYSKIFKCKVSIVYNSVSDEFHKDAVSLRVSRTEIKKRFDSKNIILPCSLKKYKGIFEFIKLAGLLPSYHFILIISDVSANINKFFFEIPFPENVRILNKVNDMRVIYKNASLTMNMSLPYGEARWIETFGMTIIESFEFGIPCFAPNYGGPKEIINDNLNGFLINPFDTAYIKSKILLLMENFDVYAGFAEMALKRVEFFSPYSFSKSIENIILEITSD